MRCTPMIVLFSALALAACKSQTKATDVPNPAPAQTAGAAGPKTDDPAKNEVVNPPDTSPTASSKMECSNKSDKRILEVRVKDKGCELAYTKAGQEAVIATGRSGNSHCEGSRDKLAEKLKGAGFTCQ